MAIQWYFTFVIPWIVLESLIDLSIKAFHINRNNGPRHEIGGETRFQFLLDNSQEELEELWNAEGDVMDAHDFASSTSYEDEKSSSYFSHDFQVSLLERKEALDDDVKATLVNQKIRQGRPPDDGWQLSIDSEKKAKSTMSIIHEDNKDIDTSKSCRRRMRRSSEYWNLHLELIQDYKIRYGHIDVPYNYEVTVGGNLVRLGNFIHWLRSLYEKELLRVTVPFQFVKILTELGMKWNFLGKGRRHQLFLQRLNEWRDVTSREARLEPVLRTWMWRQRYQYKRYCDGLSSTLTKDRIDLLIDAGIVPFQRPLEAFQYIWDEQWKKNLNEWIRWRECNDKNGMSQDIILWAWEQWRMYDILRGETPYKGDLPVLWTGYRVKDLQDANFFDYERIFCSFPPPDVTIHNLSIDWNELKSAIKIYYDQNDDLDIPISCGLRVGDYPLVFLSTRLIMETKVFEYDLNDKQDFLLLDKIRMDEIKETMPYIMKAGDSPLSLEIEWWYHFNQAKKLRRYHNSDGPLSAATLSWIGKQQERIWLLQEAPRINSNILSEVKYEALRFLGTRFEFPNIDELPASRNAGINVVGRPPAILNLNHDVLPDQALLLRKQLHKLEEMTWQSRYKDLCSFANAHGHCSVSPSDNPKLALWVKNQRLQYQKSLKGIITPLSEERKHLLLAISFDFGIHHMSRNTEEEFNRMILTLRQFKAIHGHCFIPLSLPSNPSLGDWVNRQRKAFMQQELSPENIKELRTVGLDLELSDVEYYRMAYDTLWQERMSECQQFLNQRKGGWKELMEMKSALSTWANEQKQLYAWQSQLGDPNLLTAERIHKLENLKFPFDSS
jgi:hypothetical protein